MFSCNLSEQARSPCVSKTPQSTARLYSLNTVVPLLVQRIYRIVTFILSQRLYPLCDERSEEPFTPNMSSANCPGMTYGLVWRSRWAITNKNGGNFPAGYLFLVLYRDQVRVNQLAIIFDHFEQNIEKAEILRRMGGRMLFTKGVNELYKNSTHELHRRSPSSKALT